MPNDPAQSGLDSATRAISAALTFSADGIAEVLGVWFAAKAAISTVASGVAEIVTHGTLQGVQAKFLDIPLSPLQLADMVVRNVLPQYANQATKPLQNNVEGHDIYTEASYSGISTSRLNALILDTGESYGVVDALRLWNRGQFMHGLIPTPNRQPGQHLYSEGASLKGAYGILEPELDTVIHYSRIRDQFTDDLKKLARNTLSPADAVELVVKQIVDQPTGQRLFEAAGGVAEQFDALVAGAGDSVGIEKTVDLYAHNVIDQQTKDDIVALSRMNPRFYPLTDKLADGTIPLNTHWLAPYQIRQLGLAGHATSADVLKWMLEAGYPVDQAQAFALEVGSNQVSQTKNETAGMVLAEYEAKLLTEAQATTALENLGYKTASIPFFLQYAMARGVISARNNAVARVRQGFLLGLVTSDQATNSLSQVGVPQPAINDLIADWTAEAAVPHTALTTAEIGKLLHEGYVTVAKAEQLWRMKGFTTEDVGYLLLLYPPAAKPATGPTTGIP